MPSIFGYWNIRGLGQSIRLILEYTGEEYEMKTYSIGPPPDYDRSAWYADAEELGLDFPNLPYFIDGDIKLTQSQAIVKYIARKHSLMPSTEKEHVRVDMAQAQLHDLRMDHVECTYSKDFEKLRDGFVEKNLIPNLKHFSNFLGSDQWVCGEKLTYVDFLLYECLEVNRILAPEAFEAFENIRTYQKKFESLPKIKEYLKCSRCVLNPIYRPFATWGCK